MTKSIAGVSFNVVIDSRVSASGLSKIYFRLKEHRVKRDLFTKIRWPREHFEAKTQQLLPRCPGDPDVTPFNLKLNEFKAVAHRLQLSGWLKDSTVNIDDLVKEFENVGRGDDFFSFMEIKARELYKTNVIVYGTWSRHKSSLNTLKLFYKQPVLPVNKIDKEFIERFGAWAKRVHKRGHNTICGYHKDIKKYLGIAERKCLIARNPYKDFSFKYVDGDRQALNKEEIGRLYELYQNEHVAENEREICCRFLFSCVTGLRISDTSQVHRKMIVGSVLSIIPYKTRESGKVLKIPLSKIAQSLIAGRDGLLFKQFSHGYINETLKVIAARAGIYKRLTYHCARDTFGTMFIEMGGDIKSLCDLMGHASTKTTNIYVKMSDTRKASLMNNFDKLFPPLPPKPPDDATGPLKPE